MIRKEVREGTGEGWGGIQRGFHAGCRLQAYVHKSVMEELKRIIDDSEITKEDDALWPPPDRVGRQVGVCSHCSSCSHVLSN